MKRYWLLIVLAAVVSFMPFIGIYSLITGSGDNLPERIVSNMPVCILIGFCDFLIVRRVSDRRDWSNNRKTVTGLLLATLLCIAVICVLNLLLGDFTPGELVQSALPAVPWNWVMTLLIQVYFYNVKQAETEKEKALYQLMALKNQIKPHFLFNSLNVIASLAYQDPAKTNMFAKRLSAIYRYLLTTDDRPVVTLDEELDFVGKYIYLEQIRFGEALQVNIRDERTSGRRSIIPVSIQLLVENAIKHNICTLESPLSIIITVSDSDVTVSNNLQRRQQVNSAGMGLLNLKRRYAIHGRQISVQPTDTHFTVSLPYLN